jgi:hypothetical protein
MGPPPPIPPVRTTVKGSDRQAPDLVDRNFIAERPNLLWVADSYP